MSFEQPQFEKPPQEDKEKPDTNLGNFAAEILSGHKTELQTAKEEELKQQEAQMAREKEKSKEYPKIAGQFNETSGKIFYLMMKHPELAAIDNANFVNLQKRIEVWNKLGLEPELNPENLQELDKTGNPRDPYGEKAQIFQALQWNKVSHGVDMSYATVDRYQLDSEVDQLDIHSHHALDGGGRMPYYYPEFHGLRYVEKVGKNDFVDTMKQELLNDTYEQSLKKEIKEMQDSGEPKFLNMSSLEAKQRYGIENIDKLSEEEKIKLETLWLEQRIKDHKSERKRLCLATVRGFGKEALSNEDLEVAIDALGASGDLKNPEIQQTIVTKMKELKTSTNPEDQKRLLLLAEKLKQLL